MRDYRVLIVDYDPRTVETARSILERAGFLVETAKDGAEGVDCFKRQKPDLTIAELMLPKKSGLELCQAVRSTPEGTEAPVVIMTSRFRSRQYRSQATHRFQASDFLEKPFDEATLLAVVERQLGVRRPAASGDEDSPENEKLDFEIEVVNRLDDVLGRE